MNKQKEKTAGLVVLAAVAVVVLMVLLFRVIFRDRQESAIVLPTQIAAAPAEEPEQETAGEQNLFITVTPENLEAFLESLTVPDACCQTYSVTLTAGETHRVRQVQVWKKQDQVRAVVTDTSAGTEKSLLFRDGSLWLWYAGDTEAVEIPDSQATLDALCSLPDRSSLLEQWDGTITETTYEVLDSGEATVLILAENGQDGMECRISAETGLVLSARRWDDTGTWYEAAQEAYRLLTPADEDYSSAFALPRES